MKLLPSIMLLAGVASAQEAPLPPQAPPTAPAVAGLLQAANWVPVVAPTLPAFDQVRARELYEENCQLCHGESGDGQGPVARYLEPKPRDLTRGLYKFRSTPSGDLPTDQDLFDTLTRGLPGTSMPSWSGLSVEQRWQLVQFVKTLSPRFASESAEEKVEIPSAPAPSLAVLVRGQKVWQKMKCNTCHGDGGRGDGPAADDMRDNMGEKVYPFNLTRGASYRIGAAPEDLFRTLVTGLDGTPMPSYAQTMTQEEAWDLVFYTRSLVADAPR